MTNPRRVSLSTKFIAETRELRKKYRRIEQDIDKFVAQLEQGATPGDRIQGAGGYEVYKARVASTDMRRGKSGGFRIIYYLRTETHTLLLSIYAKTEQENIPTREVLDLIELAEQAQDEPVSDADTSDNPDTDMPPSE